MLGDVAGLRKALLRHISRQKLPSFSIPGGVSQVDMASGEKVRIQKVVKMITISFFQLTIALLSGRIAVYSSSGAAEVIGTDSYADNGIVHSINALI